MSAEIDVLRAWVGKTESSEETITLDPALRFHAMLDNEGPAPAAGGELPPLWHWLYFLPKPATREMGVDGHARRGGFMPPVQLPRRMFAGSQMEFHSPLIIGREARREREIMSVERKDGREGPLVFVGVRERIEMNGRLCVEEHQTIVYRNAGAPAPTPPSQKQWAPAPADAWTRIVTPDPVLLFRFAALTFNAHRIHYDRPYATQEEGYPGLIVQGPMVAMLLLELVRHQGRRRIASYSFRSRAPLFDLAPFRLSGTPKAAHVELLAEGPGGVRAMEAQATLGD
jgi:3-methylfumaryl-CoA hydratase